MRFDFVLLKHFDNKFIELYIYIIQQIKNHTKFLIKRWFCWDKSYYVSRIFVIIVLFISHIFIVFKF